MNAKRTRLIYVFWEKNYYLMNYLSIDSSCSEFFIKIVKSGREREWGDRKKWFHRPFFTFFDSVNQTFREWIIGKRLYSSSHLWLLLLVEMKRLSSISCLLLLCLFNLLSNHFYLSSLSLASFFSSVLSSPNALCHFQNSILSLSFLLRWILSFHQCSSGSEYKTGTLPSKGLHFLNMICWRVAYVDFKPAHISFAASHMKWFVVVIFDCFSCYLFLIYDYKCRLMFLRFC